MLASGSRDYSLKMWDISSFQCVNEYKQSRNIITSITSTVDYPNVIFQSSEDLSVKLWDFRHPGYHLPTVCISGFVYFALNMDVQSSDTVVGGNGNYLATGCKGFNSVGCNVFVFDLRKLPSTQSLSEAADYSYHNNFIYSNGPELDFSGHSQDVTCCKFSRISTSHLYSCSKDGSVFIWNILEKSQVSYRFPKKYITAMSFIDAKFIPHGGNSRVEYFTLGCMDGSLVVMSYDFNKQTFLIVKSTSPSLGNDDELEY
jgi:WD40 repeat protein